MTREEAISNVRSFLGQLTEGCQESIRVLIPELAESEDERIRKEIIDWMKGGNTYEWQDNKERWLAYLERQKEQPTNSEIPKESKPEWTDADEKMLSVITYKISQHQGNDERSLFTPDEAEFICEMEDKLKSLRPILPEDTLIFRREAAKEILPAIIDKKSSMCSYEEVVKEAIAFADELIKQLKEEKKC